MVSTLRNHKQLKIFLLFLLLSNFFTGCSKEGKKDEYVREFFLLESSLEEGAFVNPNAVDSFIFEFNLPIATANIVFEPEYDFDQEIDGEKVILSNLQQLQHSTDYKITLNLTNFFDQKLIDTFEFSTFSPAQWPPNIVEPNTTMMQAFYWNMAIDESKFLVGGYQFYNPAQPYATNFPHEVNLWQYIEGRAEFYSDLGFTGFWLAPPGKAAMDGDENFYRVGYASYDPWDLGEFSQYSVHESGRTKYGTKDELVAAIAALNEHGIEAYYDIVMNQRLGGHPEVVPVQADLGPVSEGLAHNTWYSTELSSGTSFIIAIGQNGDENEFFADDQHNRIETGEAEIWVDLNDIDFLETNEHGVKQFIIGQIQTVRPGDAQDLGSISDGKFRINIKVWGEGDLSNLRVGYYNYEAESEWNWQSLIEGGGLNYYEVMALTDFSNLEGRNRYYNADFVWNWHKFNVIDYCNLRGSIQPVLLYGKEYNDTIDADFLLGSNIDYKNNQNTWREYKDLATWLVEDIGFDGFRIDAIKHIHTPFMQAWMDHVQSIDERTLFLVGEDFSGLGGLKHTLDVMDGENTRGLTLFDFELFFKFQGLGNMSMAELAHAGLVNEHGYKHRAITFAGNHDFDRDNYALNPIEKHKYQAYAYILTRKHGSPVVFWKDYYQYGMAEGLEKLLKARKYYAYGEEYEHPEANDGGVYTYTRLGLDEVPGTGLVMLISNYEGETATKTLYTGRPNVTYMDITENIEGTVTTDSNSMGEFKVRGNEATGWSVWVPAIDGFDVSGWSSN